MALERAMVLTSWMGTNGERVSGWQCNDCGAREEFEVGSQHHLDVHANNDRFEAALFKKDLEEAIEAAKNEGLVIGVEQGLILAFEVVETLEVSTGVVQALEKIAEAIDRERASRDD